ncbi:DUF2092 domain-containing protein [Candidatus Sumerlaeota bacterium]|nr:DUF2092 domain-containing protein [Candidatus Sumerlaeota bacterium]
MERHRVRQLLLLAVVLLTVGGSWLMVSRGGLIGGEGSSAAGKIEPKADKMVRDVAAYYSALKSFRVEIVSSMNMEAEGMKQQMESKSSAALVKPNKIALVLESGMMGLTLVCDGQKVYTYLPMMKKYTVADAQADFDALFGSEQTRMELGQSAFLPNLLSHNAYEMIMEGVTGLKYAGLEEIEKVKCHRLSFTQEEFDWDLWVQDSSEPLVMKVVTDMSKSIEAARESVPGLKSMKMQMVIQYRNWAPNVAIPEETFRFTPPKDAEKTESLLEGPSEEEPHPMLGKEAPDFTLDLFQGGKVELKALKGKVVVLDFWASWCPPCVRGLPVVTKVANEYKDKGVVFYGINEREDRKTVAKFLDEKKLDCAVGLDKDGKVGGLYGVEGIPQTVLIGKDGRIQSVHIGFAPQVEKTLREELDALVAGKDLATEKQEAARKEKAAKQAAPPQAKVQRVRADMRSLANACEAYNIDFNMYPAWAVGAKSVNGTPDTSVPVTCMLPSFALPDMLPTPAKSGRGARPRFYTLTTPIAYITHCPSDLFTPGERATFVYWSVQPGERDPTGKIVGKDSPVGGAGWILVSPGPDGDYDLPEEWDAYNPAIPQPSSRLLTGSNKKGSAFTYDPTNGVTSDGDIWRVKQ